MTAVASVRRPDHALAVVTAGCAVLVARPLFLDSTAEAVALFVALLAVGAFWPSRVLAVGVAAFALGRVIGGGHPPVPFAARFILLNTLAAIAEEAFFRRLLYGALERHGAALAVGGSTVLFALVHVTVYGWWVLPIDLAAGLVLSWQRWATGGWTVPAATHVVANVLVVI